MATAPNTGRSRGRCRPFKPGRPPAGTAGTTTSLTAGRMRPRRHRLRRHRPRAPPRTAARATRPTGRSGTAAGTTRATGRPGPAAAAATTACGCGCPHLAGRPGISIPRIIIAIIVVRPVICMRFTGRSGTDRANRGAGSAANIRKQCPTAHTTCLRHHGGHHTHQGRRNQASKRHHERVNERTSEIITRPRARNVPQHHRIQQGTHGLESNSRNHVAH